MLIPKMPSKEQILNSKPMKTFSVIVNTNVFVGLMAKAILTIMIWAVMLVPFWIYLVTRIFIDPTGFWQEFAVFFAFAIVIGWAQVLLGLAGVAFTFLVLFEDI